MRNLGALAVALVLLAEPAASATEAQDRFGVLVWVQTRSAGDAFPLIAGTKDWNSGEIVDTTSNHALGTTRTSGVEKGWAIAVQPNGSWSWNVGDGKNRLDYRPTYERQPVNDGVLHMLAFTLDRGRQEARLYHDGRAVAVYSTSGMGQWRGADFDTGIELFAEPKAQLTVVRGFLDARSVAAAWTRRTEKAVDDGRRGARVETLRVLAWNIWHGGRRDGNEEGLERTVAAIRASQADVVCMQETYGSGARIADALGYHFYLRSTNLSVMSRFPILETHPLYEPFRFGGVTLELSPEQRVRAFSLWINHLPGYGAVLLSGEPTAEGLVAADEETRGAEIRGILGALDAAISRTDPTPIVVAGDFNSPSHLDWGEASKNHHRGLIVEWPVSREMAAAGFTDAFRAIHPDPEALKGRTWSPRFVDAWQDRIDYVYFRGRGIRPAAARMIDEHSPRWPSDHAAVLATFELSK